MYQIRLTAPRGADAFLTRELLAWVELFFDSSETVVAVDSYASKKHKGHTLTYVNINRKTP